MAGTTEQPQWQSIPSTKREPFADAAALRKQAGDLQVAAERSAVSMRAHADEIEHQALVGVTRVRHHRDGVAGTITALRSPDEGIAFVRWDGEDEEKPIIFRNLRPADDGKGA